MTEKGYLTRARAAYYQHINTCPTCKAAPYQERIGSDLPKKDRKKLCQEGKTLLTSYEDAENAANEAAYWDYP